MRGGQGSGGGRGQGGGGQGMGGGRGQGMGGSGLGVTGMCVCPACGETVTHRRGTPCAQTPCPKCGTLMERKLAI